MGFVAEIPGSKDCDEAQIVDAIARADYHESEGHERPAAPPPAPPLAHEGGVFRRFVDGFRYDSEALSVRTILGFALFKNPLWLPSVTCTGRSRGPRRPAFADRF